MATAQRVFWETVAVLAFLVLLIGAFLWSGYRADAARSRLSAEHSREVQRVAEQHQGSLEELRSDFRRRIDSEAEARAEAAFTAFAAGAHSAIAARWTNYLATATQRFLESPGVVFVHIATPGGRIIASSDGEARATGVLDERGTWALDAKSLSTRRGATPEILELAGPVVENGQAVAVVWIGYDLAQEAREPL